MSLCVFLIDIDRANRLTKMEICQRIERQKDGTKPPFGRKRWDPFG